MTDEVAVIVCQATSLARSKVSILNRSHDHAVLQFSNSLGPGDVFRPRREAAAITCAFELHRWTTHRDRGNARDEEDLEHSSELRSQSVGALNNKRA